MNKKRPLKEGDILPAYVLRDEYGFNAENRPYFKVNEEDVPECFKNLIPLVEKWAIPCDVTRGDFFEKQKVKDISKFYNDVEPYVNRINEWLDEQDQDVLKWSEAAVHFMYFLKAHSEAYQPSEEEIVERKKSQALRLSKRAESEAKENSLLAFRERDYKKVVSLLEPYESTLEGVLKAKFELSKKRITI